jgi:hypothetical protein
MLESISVLKHGEIFHRARTEFHLAAAFPYPGRAKFFGFPDNPPQKISAQINPTNELLCVFYFYRIQAGFAVNHEIHFDLRSCLPVIKRMAALAVITPGSQMLRHESLQRRPLYRTLAGGIGKVEHTSMREAHDLHKPGNSPNVFYQFLSLNLIFKIQARIRAELKIRIFSTHHYGQQAVANRTLKRKGLPQLSRHVGMQTQAPSTASQQIHPCTPQYSRT